MKPLGAWLPLSCHSNVIEELSKFSVTVGLFLIFGGSSIKMIKKEKNLTNFVLIMHQFFTMQIELNIKIDLLSGSPLYYSTQHVLQNAEDFTHRI